MRQRHDAYPELERDLRFRPLGVEAPSVLTPAQIESYNANGYLFPIDIFQADEIAEIRAGNVASALVLAAVLVALAMLAEQGVATMLDGLLPLPTLGRDGLLAPG